MRLTHRGNVVVAIICTILLLSILTIAGRIAAADQCATFQANNDYLSAFDAGCSFDPLPNGEYPYQWVSE